MCLAAYAAAGIADAKPMQTGFYAFTLAKGLIIIPFLFVYTPILLTQGVWRGILAGVFALAGLFAITFFLEGFVLRKLSLASRFLMLIAAVLCFWPSTYVALSGLVVAVVLMTIQMVPVLGKTAEVH